jgi:hypothetical protein
MTILVDVAYAHDKPDGLLTDDLAPYWHCVAVNFDRAWQAREIAREGQIDSP